MRRAPSLKNSLSLSRVGQHIAVGAAAERSATTRPKEGPKRAQRDLRAPGWVSAVLLKSYSTRTRKCDRHLGGLVPGGEGLAAVAGRSVVEVLEPVRAVVHLARVSHGLQLQYLWIIPNAAVS